MAVAQQHGKLAKARFERETLTVNGVRVTMLTAGRGDPIVFLHGGGTFHGFDFALPWVETHRVMIPYHPGFGESGDDPAISGMHDYVLHYLELFDQLKLRDVSLIGHSLGGWMAAEFAIEHSHRLRKLVLISPAGLRDPEHPTADIFRIPPEEMPSYLVADLAVLAPHLPKEPSVDFVVNQYREITAVARVAWERPYSAALPRWLHRVKVPTLLVWGDKDRIVPVKQADSWARLIPGSKIYVAKNAGHLVLDEKPEAVERITAFLK
jgi:pimeloyl-ACP methyl ester carboxylesterase